MTIPTLSRSVVLAILSVTVGSAAAKTAPTPASPSPLSGSGLHVFGAVDVGDRNASGLVRLDGALVGVAHRFPRMNRETALRDLHAANPAARFRISPPQDVPEVLVDAVTRGDPQVLASALTRLGMENVSVYSNDVGGWLPVDQLTAAAALPELHHIQAAMPRTRTGAVTSQGDFATGALSLRTASGLTGSGIVVGALSDSFNCYSVYASNRVPASGSAGYASNGFIKTYADDQGSGDLPAGVNVLEEADCLNYGAPDQLPFGDEGRAILQIVHDLAPGAGLAYYTAVKSESDFAKGIMALANTAHAKVIDDDVGYPDEPVFQDGMVAQAVDQVESQGVAYFSSAGNDGTNSYENLTPAFPVTSTSGSNSGEMLLNFDPDPSGTQATTLPLTIARLQPGEFVFLVVMWDQPYLTGAPGSPGSANSLDLCVSGNSVDELTDEYGNSVSCTGGNQVAGDPWRLLVIGNPANASGITAAENITVTIGLVSGTPPGRVKFMLLDDGAGSTINAYKTNSPTLQGHPGASGAAAVGAAFYLYTPLCGTSPAQLETFSSAGGDPILFDTTGNRLATPIVRQKPDFVAPDGVSNTFLGFEAGQESPATAACDNSASEPNFFGTSAAAPHAAAAAALMLQANPADTPEQIYTAFQSTASPMGTTTGFNYDSGFGFIQVEKAYATLPVSTTSTPSGSSGGGGGSLDWALLLVLVGLRALGGRHRFR